MKNKSYLVLGLGNPLLTDDTVGLLAVDHAKNLWSTENNRIHFKNFFHAGLDLLFEISGYHKLIVVDSIQTNQTEPGFCYEAPVEEFPLYTAKPFNSHSIPIKTLLEMGGRMDYPMPGDIWMMGIEGRDFQTFSEKPTLSVQNAIPEISKKIILKLNEWIQREINIQGELQ